MSNVVLTVVVPAYNEEHRIGPTLEQLLGYLKSRDFPFELLVVDDCSSDRTHDIAVEFTRRIEPGFQVRVFRNEQNRGKGYSVRRGMLEARGYYALMTDADLSSPIEELPKLEEEVRAGSCDIAVGSRDVPGSEVEIHQSRFRETSGKIFNHVVRMVTPLSFRDTQCGFKLFNMTRCRPLFEHQTIDTFAFDVEILYIAHKWGLHSSEVPVRWRHSPGSRVRFVPDAFQMFMDVCRIRWNDVRGKYCRPQTTEG